MARIEHRYASAIRHSPHPCIWHQTVFGLVSLSFYLLCYVSIHLLSSAESVFHLPNVWYLDSPPNPLSSACFIVHTFGIAHPSLMQVSPCSHIRRCAHLCVCVLCVFLCFKTSNPSAADPSLTKQACKQHKSPQGTPAMWSGDNAWATTHRQNNPRSLREQRKCYTEIALGKTHTKKKCEKEVRNKHVQKEVREMSARKKCDKHIG